MTKQNIFTMCYWSAVVFGGALSSVFLPLPFSTMLAIFWGGLLGWNRKTLNRIFTQ